MWEIQQKFIANKDNRKANNFRENKFWRKNPFIKKELIFEFWLRWNKLTFLKNNKKMKKLRQRKRRRKKKNIKKKKKHELIIKHIKFQ